VILKDTNDVTDVCFVEVMLVERESLPEFDWSINKVVDIYLSYSFRFIFIDVLPCDKHCVNSHSNF